VDIFSVEYAEHLADAYAVPFAINLVLAALVFFVGRIIARALERFAGRLFERANMDRSLSNFLCDLIYALLLMIVIIAAFERLGVKTTAAIAVLGAAGLAIGLALQGSLGNFAPGVMLIFFKPYAVGDVVTVAGSTGTVESIQIFTTVLLTADNQKIIIPNGQITSDSITNITALETRRVDLVFGIGYGDDIVKARGIIESVINADERILKDPAPVIAVNELGDNSVNFVVRPWCKTSDYWAVRWSVIEQVKIAFDANGISIPFPQRDVHIHQAA
jgi:small conductance mechanosensitive channel